MEFEHFLGDKAFTIKVVVSPRLKRNIRMRILDHQNIEVRCPFVISKDTIITTLNQFSPKLLKDAEQTHENSDAEVFWHLGERYQPHYHQSTKPMVKLEDETAHLYGTNPTLLTDTWRKSEMIRYLQTHLHTLVKRTDWVKTMPSFKVRKMRSRWGSCSSKGSININSELVQAPPICIDYVILHELCHLQEFNHSPRFYALMDQVMPDWRAHQQYLREMGRNYLD